MDSSLDSAISNIVSWILYSLMVVLFVTAMSAVLNYFHIVKINAGIENFMLDVLAYGTKHNGFNNPDNGGYTFDGQVQLLLDKHKINGYVDDIRYEPAAGYQVRNKNTELTVRVTPLFPRLNPNDKSLRQGRIKKISSMTHGYVKNPGLNKP